MSIYVPSVACFLCVYWFQIYICIYMYIFTAIVVAFLDEKKVGIKNSDCGQYYMTLVLFTNTKVI